MNPKSFLSFVGLMLLVSQFPTPYADFGMVLTALIFALVADLNPDRHKF